VNDSTGGSSTSILPIGWTGWGSGSSAGVNNQAVVLKNTCNIPPGFVGSRKCEFVFTIPSNDVLYKTATVTTGPVVAGQEYLSYGEFSSTWTYSTTGEEGTDIYITNFKMVDITDMSQPKVMATAIFEGDYFNETYNSASFSKYGEVRTTNIREV
jgi:hypothetical protein